MKLVITIFIICFPYFLYPQGSNTTAGSGDDYWRRLQKQRAGELKLHDVKGTKDSIAVRISDYNFILDISSHDGVSFTGKLLIHTSSYLEGDYKSLFSKRFSTDVLLSADTAKLIFNLFSDLGVAAIPTDREVKGWRQGTDGMTYSIEYVNGRSYTFKSYWTPSAFKDLREAVVIDKFLTETETLLQYQHRWQNFVSSLPKGRSYRYGGLGIVTLSQNPADANWIERVTVTYQQSDEPPVLGGMPEYRLIFVRRQADLFCSSFTKRDQRIALEDTIILRPMFVDGILDWAKDKTIFSIHEFGLTNEDIRNSTDKANTHSLTFGTPDNLSINVDSLSFCKNYMLQKTLSTGGDHVSVTIEYSKGNHLSFSFISDGVASGFDLKDYFTCYAILNDVLPEEFPGYPFFSKKTLIALPFEYQKIVECEGYYYKEYTSKHPELTAREKRMMKGWDFKQYLRANGKVKDAP